MSGACTLNKTDNNYKICSILASVTASKRKELLDYLKAYGEENFLKKFSGIFFNKYD
jgi:hypothetical protein